MSLKNSITIQTDDSKLDKKNDCFDKVFEDKDVIKKANELGSLLYKIHE